MPNRKQAAEHPGFYIKSNVIPEGMNVTQAAKTVGVGRPALSNLLNGNSSLSSEMAAKLEKAFSASAGDLLAMQSAFDTEKSAAMTNTAAVLTFVPPFAAPKANDIESWADKLDSRAKLAALLRILVHSTCDGLRKVDFPAHDDSQRPGWDGEIETETGNPWVPAGASGWEFGTDKKEKIKGKADCDFTKRVEAISKAQRKEMTFIFVTPRRWSRKGNWREDQVSKNQWKDVLVWDSSDLEQWMEQSIPAQVWFANELGRDYRGTQSLDRCWVKWNADCTPLFTTHIFDEASVIADRKLLDHLRGSDRTLHLAADSVLEGLAFIYSTLSRDDPNLAAIRDRVVVFSETGPLTELAHKSSRFIPVVTTRETETELSETGIQLGGVSIVPRTMVQAEADIVLDTLSGEAFRTALESMGLGRDEIERLKDESGCSLTVLRRRLAQSLAIKSPGWSTNRTHARAMFPFMLAGAWKNDNKADRTILCLLADQEKYSEVEQELGALLPIESAPVWSIGSFRGVVSKIDALYAVRHSVTVDDLERFYATAELVLSERDPSLDLPEEERWAAGIYGKTRDISAALRESIADSLVILAIHGKNLFKNGLGVDTQGEANILVRRLFANMNADILESQAYDLQRYAEAAPEEFLKIIEHDLEQNDPTTQVLMRPVGNPFFSGNPRAGLLWALDTLAWSPEYLPRVVDILAKLAELEPGDSSGNTAMQSLLSIFRGWVPQTAAPVEQRIAVFDQLMKIYPEVGWAVGKDQYEAGPRIGYYSPKPKWRDYGFGRGEGVTDQERWKFGGHCLEKALLWKPMDREKLADLLTSLDLEGLDDNHEERVWERVTTWAKSASDEDRAWLREEIRVGVNRRARHLSKEDAPKSAIKARVNRARRVYDELEPDDMVWKHAWLFKNDWVEFSWEDVHKDEHNFEARDERIARQREAAMGEVFAAEGATGVVRLATSGNAPRDVGILLPEIMNSEEERLAFIKLIVSDPEFMSSTKLQFLIDGIFFSLGDGKALEFIETLRLDADDDLLVRLYCLCRFGEKVWNAVERSNPAVSAAYWRTVPAIRADQSEQELRYAVAKLIEAKRGPTALQFIYFDLKSIESEQLYEVLQVLPMSDEAEQLRSPMDGHLIKEAFTILDSRGTISRDRMARLEFMYLEMFRFDQGPIPNLEAEVNNRPALFCDAIKLAYKSKKERGNVELSEEQKQMAKNADTFIDALSAVPGRDNEGQIQADKLKAWILEARRLSDETGHRAVLDQKIGEILAHAPAAEDGVWPCEPVREAANELYSEDMARGITIGRYNARGIHSRGDGGGQERELADKYEAWAKACDYEYPRMAAVLRTMVRKYLNEAEWYDNEAMIRRRMRY